MRNALTLAAGLAAFALGAAAAPALDPAAAPGGHYVLDPRHTSVVARVRHMGLSNYTMRFDQVQGSYDYDPARPLASRISVAIDARSLDTGDPAASKQFAGEFLDAGRNPQITFLSSAIQPTDAGHGVVMGDLTFRGVTRPARLEVTYNGAEHSLIGGQRMGFSARTVIRRSQFGAKAWQGAVGDDVEVVIEAEFARH